ncbi:sugar ABC transporter permease [Streptomyces sp. NPDC006879]|uniref:sugar ABC transporter permease n=1 Tax=Streptomyces sp. NPDC006879 TaxID=3364767 RepID=UPI0036C390BC
MSARGPVPAGPSPLSRWAQRELDQVLARARETQREVGPRYPLFADPETGRWKTTGRGSWTGGTWAGLLWLMALRSGDPEDRANALDCTSRLAVWTDADTAARGLIFWYGTALAGGADEVAAMRTRAARTLLSSFEPQLEMVPWGTAFGGPRWVARLDAVPGVQQLLAPLGEGGARAARGHLLRHCALWSADVDGSTTRARPSAWQFLTPPGGGAERGWVAIGEPRPGWSRGTAWLLLAVVDALVVAEGGERLPLTPGRTSGSEEAGRPSCAAGATAGEAAVLMSTAALLIGALGHPGGPLVPPAVLGCAQAPADTSAAAITAVALLKLAAFDRPGAAAHHERGVAVLAHLVRRHCVRGRLLDGCYDLAGDLAVRHELVWGNFFLALGLASLCGLVDLRAL